jgi:hypothetical protein
MFYRYSVIQYHYHTQMKHFILWASPLLAHCLKTIFIRLVNNYQSMEQHIFFILIDYRGHHWKGVVIYNATCVSLQQKTWFHWKKCIFEHYREVQIRKSLLIDIILALIFFSDDLFRAALYSISITQRCAVPLSDWLSHLKSFFITLNINTKYPQDWLKSMNQGANTKVGKTFNRKNLFLFSI